MRFEAIGLPFVTRVLFVAALAALLPWAASAADPDAAHGATAPAAEVSDGGALPSHGVVIRWSSAAGRYESPAPEQAARLVSELRQMLAGGLAERAGMPMAAPIVERTASGLARARVPVGLVDLAVVRVAADGGFAGSCTQGPVDALETLSQAPAEPAER